MLKPGGICAWSTWENNGWIEDIRAAFATLPGPPPFPDTKTFMESWGKGEWYRTAYVEEQLVAHGFVDVKVESVPNTSTFGSPAEFCEVFSLMTGLITSKYWSAEERESCGGLIKPALLKYMTGKYGEGKPIDTHWVAILATARKPLR